LPGVANAALDFFGSPEHVLQEKHLLQSSPRGKVCLQSAFGLYASSIYEDDILSICAVAVVFGVVE